MLGPLFDNYLLLCNVVIPLKILTGQLTEQTHILAEISIRIAVYTHCQMNENPCSNQEIHVLFEHGSELENT